MKRVRLSCTTSSQVGEAIDVLLWSGLYGNSRAEVVERLVCEAVQQRIDTGEIRREELEERK